MADTAPAPSPAAPGRTLRQRLQPTPVVIVLALHVLIGLGVLTAAVLHAMDEFDTEVDRADQALSMATRELVIAIGDLLQNAQFVLGLADDRDSDAGPMEPHAPVGFGRAGGPCENPPGAWSGLRRPMAPQALAVLCASAGMRYPFGAMRMTYVLAGLVSLLLLGACSTAPQPSPSQPLPPLAVPRLSDEQAHGVAIHAMGLVGTPYRFGGNTPEGGFDCSGLIHYVYRHQTGMAPPRTVAALGQFGQALDAQSSSPSR